MPKFVIRLRCPYPKCGYEDNGIIVEANSAWAAKQTTVHCPHHESEGMEVIEVREAKEKP